MTNHSRYTATKEEATRLFEQVTDGVPLELPTLKDDLLSFLAACIKRLPTRRAVENDRARRLRAKHASGGENTTNE